MEGGFLTGKQGDMILCTFQDAETLLCNGTVFKEPEPPISDTSSLFWIYLGVYVGLVIFAGLMSGLTLGLLSLDMTTLTVLRESGTPSQKKHAARIMPIVKHHHLLLVTLLLANAVAVESMPLFLDRISDPIIAIAVSVTAVLLFGEVFPQALCSRYGLAIGATLAPLVYVLMALFFIISYPLSKLLDCMLGKEHATFYRRAELKALVSLHGPSGEEKQHNTDPLTNDEVLIIKGALEMRDKKTYQCMVPLESVYMLDMATYLNHSTMREMMKAAHSRVPIYNGDRQHIVGVILLKTLLMVDPEESLPLKKILKNSKKCVRDVPFVADYTPLYDLLSEFQMGKTHLAVVVHFPDDYKLTSSPANLSPADVKNGIVVGIITLEDVIEELLGKEIIDETDVYVDVHQKILVKRAALNLFRSMSASDVSAWQSSHETLPSTRPQRNTPLSLPTSDVESGYTDNPRSPLLENAETKAEN